MSPVCQVKLALCFTAAANLAQVIFSLPPCTFFTTHIHVSTACCCLTLHQRACMRHRMHAHSAGCQPAACMGETDPCCCVACRLFASHQN